MGIIQSSFIPWRGYFDFIASVDLFIFHDDLQYTKGDWRNRNKLKTPQGSEWLTVPVSYRRVAQRIQETPIDYASPWATRHRRRWQANYRQAPYLDTVLELLKDMGDPSDVSISQLNIRLIRRIADHLGITTPCRLSSEFAVEGHKTERLLALLAQVGATTYLSGPSGDAYLDKEAFRRHGLGLEYKSYDYPPYPQLWGAFDGAVSVLDLIANTGPEATKYLRSRQPNRVVVP